jgi:hypothetical protein
MPATQNQVEVIVKTAGLVIGHVARHPGEIVSVDADTALQLRAHADIKVLPLVRANRDNLTVGNRVLQRGETAYSPTEALALSHHISGSASILNAPDVPMLLPPRKRERKDVQGNYRVRMLKDVYYPLRPSQMVGQGEEVDVGSLDRASQWVRDGLAEVIGGWKCRPRTRVFIRANSAGLIGNRIYNAGEIGLEYEDQLAGAFDTNRASVTDSTPVRIRAIVECDCDDRTLAPGKEADILSGLAAYLITDGLAELVSGAWPAGLSPAPSTSKSKPK